MERKSKDPPTAFRRTHIASVYVSCNLVVVEAKGELGPIMTLMDVLVQILHGLQRRHDLHIDVALKASAQVGTVSNDVSVIERYSTFQVRNTGVSATVRRKEALVEVRGLDEVLWELLAAVPVLHARRLRISESAGSVNHASLDDFEKLCLRIGSIGRKFRTHSSVDGLCVLHLVRGSDAKEQMPVWQSALLELNNPTVCDVHTQDVFFE